MCILHRFLFFVFLISAFPASMAGNVLIEAENFKVKGGWSVDQQFMDIMGSPYLIAHGIGKPAEDAYTDVSIDEDGLYHVYARTYNWTSPWSDKEGPGLFRIKIGRNTLKYKLGGKGDGWFWQYAGSVRLKKGRTTLRLCDLTGFDGRCDAVWLTKSAEKVPPSDVSALEEFRRRYGTVPAAPSDTASFDFVVVGGGIAGICAAVSAARNGCKVALVNDRPVLGGNNSSEIRVHLGGRIEIGRYPALGRMIREFGHEQFGNAAPAQNYKDSAKTAFILSEPRITYYPNFRAVRAEMDKDRINSVIIRNIETAEEVLLKAHVFSDCTGDGNLGVIAGADWTDGREGQDEFGESLAPLKKDSLTMGVSIQWYAEQRGRKTKFPLFEYGVEFNDANCERVLRGDWDWETGLDKDKISQAEQIRDFGMLVVYSNWSYLKNRLGDKEFDDKELEWVAYIAGKRESRRLLGDHILTQRDIEDRIYYEDGSFTISWHLDLHFIDPENSKLFPGKEFKAATRNNLIYPYDVPYRCLYSRNIRNLFMAGRNISVSHVALGSARLMRTTGMMGEVVGMAASLCLKNKVYPREIYNTYLPQLQELMHQGAAIKGELPDNQNFNEGGHLTDPVFSFRAVLIDPARNFLPAEDVLSFIDSIAALGFNKLQLHLSDNEGWRLPVDGRLELTGGGEYYTKEELKRIVHHGIKKGVEIIPELDIPGHTGALLRVYPELSCEGGKGTMLCASKQGVYDLLDEILKEITDIFPGQYIHLGGDEADISSNWEICKECSADMMEYFFAKVLGTVKELGRKPILWCEPVAGDGVSEFLFNYPKDVLLVSWRRFTSESCIRLAEENGNKLIMAPAEYVYFDFPQYEGDVPGSVMPVTTLEQVKSFDPLYGTSSTAIHGVLCALWGEDIPNYERLLHMAYPRIRAVADILKGKKPEYSDVMLWEENFLHPSDTKWTRTNAGISSLGKASFREAKIDIILKNKDNRPSIRLLADARGAISEIKFFADASFKDGVYSLTLPGDYPYYFIISEHNHIASMRVWKQGVHYLLK